MLVSKTIEHLTITTGHLRSSPRHEAADVAIAWCKIMLAWLKDTGRAEIAVGFEMVGECTDTWLDVMVHRMNREALLLHIAAVKSDADAPIVWRRICQDPELPMPGVPWVAADIIQPDMELMQWAGDFERCLAWALVES